MNRLLELLIVAAIMAIVSLYSLSAIGNIMEDAERVSSCVTTAHEKANVTLEEIDGILESYVSVQE